jgi:hypothetical protein
LLPPDSPDPEPEPDLEPDLEEEQLGPLDILPDPEPEPEPDLELDPEPDPEPDLEPEPDPEELDPPGVQAISSTVTVQSDDAVHPLASVTVNVYTVVAAGHTIIDGVLSPFDQL